MHPRDTQLSEKIVLSLKKSFKKISVPTFWQDFSVRKDTLIVELCVFSAAAEGAGVCDPTCFFRSQAFKHIS
jgi:hypothetical protein